MMLTNVTIELSGIKRIVVDQTKVYERNADNTWTNKKNGKKIEDHKMMINIKGMLREHQPVYGDRVSTDFSRNRLKYTENILIGSVHKYRPWVHLETLNIERVL